MRLDDIQTVFLQYSISEYSLRMSSNCIKYKSSFTFPMICEKSVKMQRRLPTCRRLLYGGIHFISVRFIFTISHIIMYINALSNLWKAKFIKKKMYWMIQRKMIRLLLRLGLFTFYRFLIQIRLRLVCFLPYRAFKNWPWTSFIVFSFQ